MIPVPQPVLESLAKAVGTTGVDLSHFAGGREENDKETNHDRSWQ
jgi:hypothetical protein